MNHARFLPRFLPLIALLLVFLVVAIAPVSAANTVDVQILALNDFHGNLEPAALNFAGTPAGGVAYLATHINNHRATNPNTIVASAGDLIGASPLISALFHDEPTIEAFNLIGLDVNAVGNHEFDEGVNELIRMQRGGCHPVDGCQDGDKFRGADFRFLAANVVYENSGRTIFPATYIRGFKGVKIAFIGMTLEGTPSIVTPSGVAKVDFLDEAETVNKLVSKLKKQGIETFVVLIHEGGVVNTAGGVNGCTGISGAIVDIVNNTTDEVDLFISGHTHQAYNCVIDGRPVTSASSFGRVLTDIDMTLDRKTKEPISISVNNNIVTRDVTQDSELLTLVAKYNAIVAPLRDRVIGSITAEINRVQNAAGESALGDVIADAQLAATENTGGAVVAFMNPGGIRTELFFPQSGSEGDGNVTYGEAFAVQPFGNSLVTMTLTGAQIDTLLEQQFNNPTAGQNRILQVSEGFEYTWSQSAPVGSKVDIASIKINGVVINPASSYRVTVNIFLSDGGDNFFVLREGTNRLGGDVDLDALEAYFVANSPVPPGPQNRITVVP
jgi:5'-nucleotidase